MLELCKPWQNRPVQPMFQQLYIRMEWNKFRMERNTGQGVIYLTERCTSLFRNILGSARHLNREEVYVTTSSIGISLLFVNRSSAKDPYTQEKFFYTWENNRFVFLGSHLLIVTGTPEETISNLPLVIAQEGRGCTALNVCKYAIAVTLTDKSAEAIRSSLQAARREAPCSRSRSR